MGLLKRVGFYLGGFAIGLVIITFIFKGKDTEFCYSPNCRVLKNIRSKKIDYIKETSKDSTAISTILKEGDVIFSKSNTDTQACKTYVIEGKISNTEMEISIKNCDSIATVQYYRKVN
ncbi:DUF4258 domain-containing protein [Ascidiimonas sp. W6]|uniref:DUF4258 domain-containing protein n=1 Tax=Ascidiimonas meishanensis TaxID=3128903 RepID=UPI0030EBC1DC